MSRCLAPLRPPRLLALLPALLLVLLAAPEAAAQGCGNWSQPVLCQVELRSSIDGDPWERFDPYDGQRLAPNQLLELEIDGRDQYGRTFRADRIVLGFEDRDCDGTLRVTDLGEGRLEIEASGTMGRCRLELWVPGNMNFEWRVELEVTPEARTTYSRAEADIVVRALYWAILNRAPDTASIDGAIFELQRGNLQAQAAAMLRSTEFQQSLGGVDPGQLLDRFYEGILERPADAPGVQTYFADMQRRRYLDVILRLLRSPEFEERLQR